MTTLLASPSTSPAFRPEPGLPWLRHDPAMQCPKAFVDVHTVDTTAYVPMLRHFPDGATLAVVRVTRAADLTEGVYLVNGGPQSDRFGRFAGLAAASSDRTQARRLQQGFVHFELSTDVAVPHPRHDYHMREDGTFTCYINFNDASHKLYRVTHYVSLPPAALAALGPEAAQAAGLSAEQQRWLDEEALIRQGKAEEYRVHVLGTLPDDDLRVVLSGEQLSLINYLLEGPKPLTYSQAKKCKAGAVAITSRSAYTGRMFINTGYYKQPAVAVLLDWFASLARLRRTEAAARALSDQNRAAYQQHLAGIRQAAQALGNLPQVATEELALAA